MEWKLAEQIRAYRQEKGMTQERLAEAVGVTVGAVSKWESGASVPELSALVELASLFGTSVDALIGYEVPDNALPALLRRLRACRDAHQFDEGDEIAGRLLRCYPNSFEAVYHAAGFYYCQGLTQAEKQEMRRAIALYERSLALLSQNTGKFRSGSPSSTREFHSGKRRKAFASSSATTTTASMILSSAQHWRIPIRRTKRGAICSAPICGWLRIWFILRLVMSIPQRLRMRRSRRWSFWSGFSISWTG